MAIFEEHIRAAPPFSINLRTRSKVPCTPPKLFGALKRFKETLPPPPPAIPSTLNSGSDYSHGSFFVELQAKTRFLQAMTCGTKAAASGAWSFFFSWGGLGGVVFLVSHGGTSPPGPSSLFSSRAPGPGVFLRWTRSRRPGVEMEAALGQLQGGRSQLFGQGLPKGNPGDPRSRMEVKLNGALDMGIDVHENNSYGKKFAT